MQFLSGASNIKSKPGSFDWLDPGHVPAWSLKYRSVGESSSPIYVRSGPRKILNGASCAPEQISGIEIWVLST